MRGQLVQKHGRRYSDIARVRGQVVQKLGRRYRDATRVRGQLAIVPCFGRVLDWTTQTIGHQHTSPFVCQLLTLACGDWPPWLFLAGASQFSGELLVVNVPLAPCRWAPWSGGWRSAEQSPAE